MVRQGPRMAPKWMARRRKTARAIGNDMVHRRQWAAMDHAQEVSREARAIRVAREVKEEAEARDSALVLRKEDYIEPQAPKGVSGKGGVTREWSHHLERDRRSARIVGLSSSSVREADRSGKRSRRQRERDNSGIVADAPKRRRNRRRNERRKSQGVANHGHIPAANAAVATRTPREGYTVVGFLHRDGTVKPVLRANAFAPKEERAMKELRLLGDLLWEEVEAGNFGSPRFSRLIARIEEIQAKVEAYHVR